MTNGTLTAEKPRLRGQLHKYAFFASLPAGAALLASSASGLPLLTAAVFAISVAALLGISAP